MNDASDRTGSNPQQQQFQPDSPAKKSPPRYSRAHHRARQHESAHAEASSTAQESPIEHPLVPRGAGELIDTNASLSEFIAHLRSVGSFAYDSEFIGELSYHPQLCLIQASTPQRIGLIDPMAPGIDLRPFWDLLADASVEKVVHAGEQDIEPVHRLTGSVARNVFDTQISAGFVGLAYPVGLSKLVLELLGAKLGKGLTFTHWDQRPLSAVQLRYAADDVRYLPAIRAELGRRLEANGHTDWAREECDSLCDPKRYGFDPESQFLKIRGAGSLGPAGLAVLRELTIWRDQAAREADQPARAFLKDEILLDMAHTPIKQVEKLDRVKGLPRPVEAEHGQRILQATAKGLAVPANQRPPGKEIELSPTERFGAESLYLTAAAICAGAGIDPALVASRQDITDLFRALKNDTKLPDLRVLGGWRAKACGDKLINMYRGVGSLSLSWSNGELRSAE